MSCPVGLVSLDGESTLLSVSQLVPAMVNTGPTALQRPLVPSWWPSARLGCVPFRCKALCFSAGKPWRGRMKASSARNHCCEAMTQQELQELSWQEFFADPTQWFDHRGSKETPRHPDFRHKNGRDALWLNNWHKPAWVDSQLALWDAGMWRPPESVSSSVQGRLGPYEGSLAACRKLCEDGQVNDAVDALNLIVQRRIHIPQNLFYRILKRCIAHEDLVLGKRVHALTMQNGYDGNAFLATHLINMYASHGRLGEAMQVFSKVTPPSAYNWASIIFAYARHGEPTHAIELYRQMRTSTVKPDNRIFVAVLKACAKGTLLAAGKEVHSDILASAVQPDIFVQNSLVDMYAKCGSIEDAREVFDRLLNRDVVTWNALIAGYAHHGMGEEALCLYSRMKPEGITQPGPVTFVSLLQACACVGETALDQGKQFHVQIEKLGAQADDVVLGASLVNMYSKCGSLEDARRLFDGLSQKDVVTWNTMIAGYVQQGMVDEALNLYSCMQDENITPPDAITFACLLQACASLGAAGVHQGKQVHSHIGERGVQNDVILGNSLVNMYAKCGSLQDGRRVFDSMSHKDVESWNVMIAGYVDQGMCQEAVSLYLCMHQEGVTPPNHVTFVCLLQASANIAALPLGKKLHAQIEDAGLQADVTVGASLVNMYAKCGNLEDAHTVFDRLSHKNTVTWTALIAGYAHKGMGHEALSLYSSMQREDITPPDSVTFVCLLQACASVAALQQGKQLHHQIEMQGLQADVVVGNTLVNMYAKCGSLDVAHRVFDGLPQKDVVTWTAMIAGYAQQEMGHEALSLYSRMQEEGITPTSSVTFVCLLQACASAAALPLGKQLHLQIHDRGLQDDASVGTSLVNMYAKCGSMVDAQQVFDSLPERDIVAWGALIGGYTRQGDCEAVFELVDRMKQKGLQPNGITSLNVLTVCSHRGLVDKGREHFEAMSTENGISPTIEHYTCMTDLLGRAGHLDEALQMVKTMPFQPNAAICLSLMAACQKWSNVEVGRQAFELAERLDEKDAAAYVLMSNIYAGAELWEEAKEMQARRVRCGAWKEPGRTWWTDMRGLEYSFVVSS